MSSEWPPTDDPLFDPDDPAAVEREERRREREEKRRSREAKKGKKEPSPPSPPPPPTPAEPPAPPRTPEQEFWDEDPTPAPPAPGQEPVTPTPADRPAPDPGMVERGRRRLLGRHRSKDPAPTPASPEVAAPKATPEEDAATSPEDDSLGPAALGGAAAATPGPAAAAAGASDPDASASNPSASDPNPATGEHQAPGDPGPSTHEYAAPPPPPEEPNTGDWHPLERDWDFHEEGDPEMAGAARAGRRRGEDGGNRRGGLVGALVRHPFRILAVIVLLVVLWFLNGLFQPFHGDGHGGVQVTIPKGAGVGEVGDILERRGVIEGSAIVDASTLFQMRVTLAGERGDLYAGHFKLEEDMSFGSAIDALSKEPSAKTKPGITTVTIPEGYSRPLAAKLVSEDGVPGNYVKATKKSKVLNPAEYGGKGARNLEGFLFPDTFELKPKAPVKDLVALQLQDFKKKIKQVNMKYANSKNLTIFDVLTIASMVEREAGVPKQRKLVASVIYNRLHDGMPLGIDATIRFATGNYEKPLTQSQLETSSPYNTRTNQGLPPGPINSPGLAAIQAAAHAAKTDFLFYVNNPRSCNELSFSKTEEEFEADVQKYEAAREKAGGNAPSTCGE